MSNHTPTWATSKDAVPAGFTQITVYEGSSGERVATVYNDKAATLAPELLEALIAALPYVEMAELDEAYKKGAVAKVTKQMLAAIAKAEGEPNQ